jgi:hypothetical protein
MAQERGELDRVKLAFPRNFFDALNSGDTDLAFRCLGAEAKTPEGMLTPKAADYNKQGEWDSLMGLHLGCLGDGYCGGRVGQDGYRVCGKAPGECAAKSHDGAKQLSAGWYVSAGGRAAGFYSSPKLPLATAGGPITARAAGLLVDGENPYKLTKGQWQFVFDAWNASKGLRVEVVNLEEGDAPQDQESPTAGFEHVEATDAGGPTLFQDPAPSGSTQGAGAQMYASAILELTQTVVSMKWIEPCASPRRRQSPPTTSGFAVAERSRNWKIEREQCCKRPSRPGRIWIPNASRIRS